jgi:alkylation response protein AidB-like acyl-CoA dehydrogenase
MHIGDTDDEAAFRAEARAWLKEHAPARHGGEHAVSEDLGDHVAHCRTWQATLAEHGWAGITWPAAYGGRGGTAIQSAIFAEEQANVDVATGAFAVAIGMVGPTLIAHGTHEQQERFLGAMLRGEHVWCQLFSEPGAGSDLASLGTRAERVNGRWVVNGQKVWTSLGQHADWGILLARTDPDAPKHAGITYFLVDMRTPGIEVRPLTQITGVAHFNEVFLTDVVIDDDCVVGAIGDGWSVARTTLLSERSFIGSGTGSWSVDQLIDTARKLGRDRDPVVRQQLAAAVCRARVLEFLGYRMRTAMSQGRMPGPEMFVLKLAYARHWAATADTAMSVLGTSATLGDFSPASAAHTDNDPLADDDTWQTMFLTQYAIRLGGGTDEVQHNIIGEQALGLPREPSADKGVPWRELAHR